MMSTTVLVNVFCLELPAHRKPLASMPPSREEIDFSHLFHRRLVCRGASALLLRRQKTQTILGRQGNGTDREHRYVFLVFRNEQDCTYAGFSLGKNVFVCERSDPRGILEFIQASITRDQAEEAWPKKGDDSSRSRFILMSDSSSSSHQMGA